MAKRSNDLAHDSVGRLMLRLAIPTVVAQVVNALYNIVDRIYIGHIKEVGDLALTGLGICFPIIMFISALSALVGTGGGSRAAIAMGEGDSEGANRILGNCATLMAIISVLATVLFQIFKEPLLLLFGASPNTVGYATDYLGIYLWGTIFVQISLGLNTFITTQGFSTFSMATVLVGAGVNIVLDPVFIFGFGMGVKGAALATVIAQGVSAVWVLTFLLGYELKTAVGTSVFIMTFSAMLGAVSHFALGSAPRLLPLALCVVFTLFWAQLAARIAAKADPILLNRLTGAILTAVGLLLLVLNLL